VSLDRVLAIARRVILQIRYDRRTLALLFLVPLVVMTLVNLSMPEMPGLLDYLAPALLAALALFFVFILTSVSFLRERLQGTLERLQASPVTRGDIVLGYWLGLLLFAAIQSLIILLYTIWVFRVHYRGSLAEVFLFQMLITAGGLNMGILASTYARNEFQVVQFIPLLLLPQFFLGGLLWPVEQMPGYLQALARILPLTYAIKGLRAIMLDGKGLLDTLPQLAFLGVFAAVMLFLAALTLRRAS